MKTKIINNNFMVKTPMVLDLTICIQGQNNRIVQKQNKHLNMSTQQKNQKRQQWMAEQNVRVTFNLQNSMRYDVQQKWTVEKERITDL